MPNPFIPLPVLLQKLDALRNEVLAQNLPEKQRSLHGRGQQQDLEGWQAFVFAVAYSRCFKLSEMCVQLAEEQYSAHDATLRWVKGEQQQFLKIQLKGLARIFHKKVSRIPLLSGNQIGVKQRTKLLHEIVRASC